MRVRKHHLIIQTLIMITAIVVVGGCGSPKHEVPISRSISQARKKGVQELSAQSRELLGLKKKDCLDLPEVVKNLKQSGKIYTFHVSDVEIMRLDPQPDKAGCRTFKYAQDADEIARAKQAFSEANLHIEGLKAEALDLTKGLNTLLDVTSQQECNNLSNSSSAFQILCHSEAKLQTQQTATNDEEIRLYSISDKGLTIFVYKPQINTINCSATNKEVFWVRTQYELDFGYVQDIRMSARFYGLLKKYVDPAIELSLASKTSENGYLGAFVFDMATQKIERGQFALPPVCPAKPQPLSGK